MSEVTNQQLLVAVKENHLAIDALDKRQTTTESDVGWIKKLLGWIVYIAGGILLSALGILGTVIGIALK